MRYLSGLFLLFALTILQACGGASNREQLAAQTPVPTTPTTLFTTAPGSITFLSGASSGTYTISGGVSPFAASSSNTSVAAVSASGSTFTIAPGLVGTATVFVIDSVGTRIEIAITVGSGAPVSALRTTAPGSIAYLAGASSSAYSIAGGVTPYAVSSSNTAVASATLTGGSLTIAPGQVGSATVFVIDSVGTRIEIAVTVGGNTQVTALRTSAASAITLGNGGSASFTIAGGVSPYLTSSSNNNIALSDISGSNLFITGGQVAGTAQVLVIDATGTQVVISVTVGAVAAQPLFTTAASAITVSSGGGISRFVVGGGTPPYAASSSNAAVATVSVTGTALNVTAGSIGSATLVVLDSLGAKVEIALTVGTSTEISPLRTSAPGAVTLGTTQTVSYVISGGVAPYLTSNSSPSVLSSSVSGSTLTITSGSLGGAAQVLVIDTAGTQLSIAVTVSASASQALFTSAPSAVSMASGAAPATFAVGGGLAPYTASSSNVGNARASITGNTLTVTSVSVGPATIAVVDALGARVEFIVTVGSGITTTPLRTDAPSAITLAPGNVRIYTVSGGQAPYASNSANEGIATARMSGNTLTVTAIAAGSTQVLVIDSDGTQALIGVTVGGATPTALFVAAPSAVTVPIGGAPVSYNVGGGTPPYSAQSSNTAVASVTVSGATLGVSGLAGGSATVTVFDATGTQVSVLVTVSANAVVALSVLPAGASGNVGDVLTFTAHGGSPAYSLLSNNTSIATLSTASVGVDGGSFTATLVNVGDAVVTARDSLGQTLSFVVSVALRTPQLRVSPGTLVVGENETGAITLNVYGGTAPYRVLTSDLVKSAVSIVGSVVTIQPGSSTNRCINPVTDATPPVYILGGTYDVTVTVIDSLGASATSVMTIRDNGAGLNTGCP